MAPGSQCRKKKMTAPANGNRTFGKLCSVSDTNISPKPIGTSLIAINRLELDEMSQLRVN